MTKRRLHVAAWMAICLASAVGCCGTGRVYRGDCHGPILSARHGGGCADGSCADGNCAGGGCADGQCGPGQPCGGGCRPQPLRTLWNMFSCSSGCGEFYFNEWINDPPEHCDPCDDHGGYVGPRSCERNFSLSTRFGCVCGADCGGACSHGQTCGCGEAGCSDCHGEPGIPADAEVIEPQRMEPTPATASRAGKAYYTPPRKVAQAPRAPTAAVRPRVAKASHTAPRPAAHPPAPRMAR